MFVVLPFAKFDVKARFASVALVIRVIVPVCLVAAGNVQQFNKLGMRKV